MGIANIDGTLRRGLGYVGKVIGSQFTIYRLQENAASSVVDPLNIVRTNFPARIVRGSFEVAVEQSEIYNMMYVGACDTRQLEIGDVLVETGPVLTDTPDGRMFVLANVQPLLPAVFVRTEINGALSRPDGSSGAPQPLLGAVPYQGETKFTEMLCSLEQGLYAIPGNGRPAVIPMGIQPHKRLGSGQEFKFPTATHRGSFFVYVPPLPGVQIQSGDIVSGNNGDRFLVHSVSTGEVGLMGYQLQCESLFT